jgi:membrane associated rhomboid family serine protease
MFPVGDDNVRGSSRPWVTWIWIAINVVVFLYELILGLDGLRQRALLHDRGQFAAGDWWPHVTVVLSGLAGRYSVACPIKL